MPEHQVQQAAEVDPPPIASRVGSADAAVGSDAGVGAVAVDAQQPVAPGRATRRGGEASPG